MKYHVGDAQSGFRVISIRPSTELNALVIEMVHEKTGARLCWVNNKMENMVFSIAFRTLPEDNTGVFHILEHSVLCGSEKYSVREPFVELLKGSMNTFLNAMTFQDMTMYPVASRNTKDLLNLTEVYLDAVFRPRILRDELVFRQEGWHIEPDEITGKPVYKGVVFNEMKGSMSDVNQLGETELSRLLFPDTGYGYNSGGDPEVIPSLSYKKYTEIYCRYYHPSNAWIYLDGAVPMEQLLPLIASYLDTYECEKDLPSFVLQKPVPSQKTVYYELGQNENPENKGHLYLSRLIGTWKDKCRNMAIGVLGDVLTGTNEAPLKRLILEKNLAQDFSMTMDDSSLQSILTFHAENLTDGMEDEILRTLAEYADQLEETGLDPLAVEASLNRFIFSLREEDEPQGIERAVRVMSSWLYDGDPLFALENNDQIAELHKMSEDGRLNRLAVSLLKQSEGFCTLRLLPSKTLGEEKRLEEAIRLDRITAAWTSQEKRNNDALLSALQSWQDNPDSEEALASLPMLKKEDANVPLPWPVTEEQETECVRLLYHPMPSGGLVHLRAYITLTDMSIDELQDISLICALLGKLPTARHDIRTLQQEIKRYTGRLGFTVMTRRSADDASLCTPCLVVFASVLPENVQKAQMLLVEILRTTDFSGSDRITEIVMQLEMASRQRIVSAGHIIGIRSTLSRFSAEYALKNALEGSQAVVYLHRFANTPDSMLPHLRITAEKFMHNSVCRKRLVLSLTADHPIDWHPFLDSLDSGTAVPAACRFTVSATENQGFRVPAQVGFAVRGWNIARSTSDFHGSWFLISNLVTYSWLWNRVRVQGGAYGCGLQVDRYGNIFSYSYRDPTPNRTLTIDAGTPGFLRDFVNSHESLDKYVISTLNDLNPLLSPREKGAVADSRWFSGYTQKQAEKIRSEIFNTSSDDLIRAADLLADFNTHGSVCVVAPDELLEKCPNLIVSDL